MIFLRTWNVIETVWDAWFKRAYRKRIKENSRLKGKFWERMELFFEDPFAPSSERTS